MMHLLIIGSIYVAKLIIFLETAKKKCEIFGGLTEKYYFCQQKKLKLKDYVRR